METIDMENTLLTTQNTFLHDTKILIVIEGIC